MKRFNKKRKPTKAESEWVSRVASLPCVVTSERAIQIHHLVECGRRLGNWWVIPLSVETHRDIYKIPFAEQIELCKQVYKLLGREWKQPFSKLREYDN
jgi:hypothetical protein